MRLLDVNVLVYAARVDATDHSQYADWLQNLVNGNETFAIADLVFSGFLRVTTNPRIFKQPSTLDEALTFVAKIREAPSFVCLSPGARHREIFVGLLRSVGAKGNLVADAYLAALAIESGSEWITTDRDYSRFPGLRWQHPLA